MKIVEPAIPLGSCIVKQNTLEDTIIEPPSRTLESSLPASDLPRVVIIGGGFAGIALIQKLRKCPVETVMLDKNNYHTFIPLLYQVATAGLSPGDISSPLRELLQDDDHFHFRMAAVESIDRGQQEVQTNLGSLHYDYLVIATGSKTNFFGNEKIEDHAQKLREIKDALELRSHLINNFERALLARDKEELQRFMNIVIVGAGPTGVELAGAVGELRDHILPKDYPELDFTIMNIYLVEGSGKVLNAMSDFAGRNAKQYLEDFGVQVKLDTLVKGYEGSVVTLSDDTKIASECLIWAAGVEGNHPDGFEQEVLLRGRIKVDDHNRIEGFEKVFAIGDVAHQALAGHESGLPMLAPVAIQQAEHLGGNLRRLLQGKALKPFKYTDKGTMATIGRNRAVVDAPFNISFGGFFGWFVWMFIHVISIVGFRRKLMVFTSWVWNYLTYNRGNRLIIHPHKKAAKETPNPVVVEPMAKGA
ncbi:MAG: NAD(P)/FAD-dependent oxidoreductase [Cyclobacteriaceae bacterium]|nr:NAD(P)/FAD-dependent oxidoreductase [Cyclobacteriaceae bacterium HetDA_MAG_MS6]